MQLKLSELQRIRDALMRLRDYSPMIRVLWTQVAGLYERLAKQPRNAGPILEPAKEV